MRERGEKERENEREREKERERERERKREREGESSDHCPMEAMKYFECSARKNPFACKLQIIHSSESCMEAMNTGDMYIST